MKTITAKEYDDLVLKGKNGWKAFYQLLGNVQSALESNQYFGLEVKHCEPTTQLEKQLVESYKQLHKLCECGRCGQSLQQGNMAVLSNCGHVLCKPCRQKCFDHKCPRCKTPLFKR